MLFTKRTTGVYLRCPDCGKFSGHIADEERVGEIIYCMWCHTKSMIIWYESDDLNWFSLEKLQHVRQSSDQSRMGSYPRGTRKPTP